MTPPAQADFAATAATSPALQLTALLKATGVSLLNQTGWLRVTGGDRVRWLNGMVTNSIQQLKPNEGNYNFLLNAQGRIQGDATIFAQPDALLIETSATQLPNLLAHLDHFIIMDDVELTDISATQSGILVAGPQAPSLLAKIGINVDSLESLTTSTLQWNTTTITVTHAHSPVVPKFELWTTPEVALELLTALTRDGAIPCDPQSLESLRILEGTPLYGTDIRNSEKARELPQETAQTRALHFNKGCYLGQEIVERIRSRGNVHRTFAAFRLDGELPAAGSPVEAENKAVGELTSVANIELPDGTRLQLALGYIRREALDRNLPLHYPGGTATPVQLPFYAAAALARPICI
jgi:folate-binding protein YgfZ